MAPRRRTSSSRTGRSRSSCSCGSSSTPPGSGLSTEVERGTGRSAGRGSPLAPRPDERLLSGWGRTPRSRSTVRRAGAETLFADVGARGVIPRGLGRSYGDAAMNAGGIVLDMTGATEIRLDPAAGTVAVAAGTSLDELMRRTIPAGWFVPVTPGTRQVTVGGAIAADVHGKNHHRDGSFGRFVRSFELRSPGQGRITVRRDAMPDVFDATAGGMGLTGVILEAELDLIPIESAFMRVDTERASDLDDLMERMESGDERA